MDVLKVFVERQQLVGVARQEFGDDTASELTDLADRFATKSMLAPNRTLELAIQFQREFGRAEEVFDEATTWVDRTAEDHHPHNLQLYLKALIWVVNRRRVRARL